MFNNKFKKEALKKLKESVSIYDKTVEEVQNSSLELFSMRQKSGNEVIKPVEEYINKLANSPKEFDISFAEYKAEFQIFSDLIDEFYAKSVDTNVKTGSIVGAGVAAGAGTATLMPSAAMAIATTFGTASTGIPIASLSGAAATKAALAWLGGGTLVKGGAGIAGGKALLALAGPIGWSIGGIGILGGGLYMSSKNKKIAQEINNKRKEIETANSTLKASKTEITELINLTKNHKIGVLNLLKVLKRTTPNDYSKFNSEAKIKLGALINHINSLTALLNKKVA